MSAERPPFRPDIEGLRGIAILLVVLYHAGVPALAGGFVGVDVFFVLSGFFITGLLVREREATGEVSLTEFYARRALRLLPALLLVLGATLVAVMTLYAPIDRAAIASSARAVALHAGNVELARTAVDYFGSGENPLLHTWSLAVEEQFYLVWPLFFLFVALVGERAAPGAFSAARARKSLLAWLAFAALVSFGASVWLTHAAQPWAFFGMPTRVWEFALGGALTVILAGAPPRREMTGAVLQAAGLAAIVMAALIYDRSTLYPGVAAIVPALAACALIAGGAQAPESVVSRALSASPLRWLGRMSYAWYLWHWPLIGLGTALAPRIGVGGRIVWATAALGLAWLTHRFVERPARAGAMSRIPTSRVAPLALAASVVMAIAAHLAMRSAERAERAPDQRAFAAAREDRMDHGCWSNTLEDAKTSCLLGDASGATTIALLGDSHAEHWLGGLDRAGRERGWKIEPMVKGGCPVADIPADPRARAGRLYARCVRYREAMLRRIIAMKPDAVILSSWDHYVPTNGSRSRWQVTPEEWSRGLRKTYVRLAAAGIHVVALRDVPRTWFDAPACLSRRAARLPFASDCSYEREESISRTGAAAQDRAASGLPIRIVDLNDQICATPRCAVVRNSAIVFTDDNHLTASFSRTLAPVLGERIAAAIR
ncbi:MAG TPA: acyltransferase family protein [Gemmatimonadaceae bacterium]|nr:acyltransferase family protein [Gemmatimonadaceae bacterium]